MLGFIKRWYIKHFDNPNCNICGTKRVSHGFEGLSHCPNNCVYKEFMKRNRNGKIV